MVLECIREYESVVEAVICLLVIVCDDDDDDEKNGYYSGIKGSYLYKLSFRSQHFIVN